VDLGVSVAVRDTAGYRGAIGLLLAGETSILLHCCCDQIANVRLDVLTAVLLNT
jgi:hypothetical protein